MLDPLTPIISVISICVSQPSCDFHDTTKAFLIESVVIFSITPLRGSRNKKNNNAKTEKK